MGLALIQKESASSYQWIFNSFLEASGHV